MKKIALSGLLIITFIAYVIHQRLEADEVAVTPATSIISSASPSSIPSTPTGTSLASAMYKDGTYDGPVTDAFYGNIQVRVVVSGGKITDVKFLDYPQDRQTSIEINTQAMPLLKQETIQAQSAKVDIVSGATQTSNAFRESLQAALQKAT